MKKFYVHCKCGEGNILTDTDQDHVSCPVCGMRIVDNIHALSTMPMRSITKFKTLCEKYNLGHFSTKIEHHLGMAEYF